MYQDITSWVQFDNNGHGILKLLIYGRVANIFINKTSKLWNFLHDFPWQTSFIWHGFKTYESFFFFFLKWRNNIASRYDCAWNFIFLLMKFSTLIQLTRVLSSWAAVCLLMMFAQTSNTRRQDVQANEMTQVTQPLIHMANSLMRTLYSCQTTLCENWAWIQISNMDNKESSCT